MRVVLQRVLSASVQIEGKLHAEIDQGLLLLVGVEAEDTLEDINWLVKKIVNMRIFHDDEGKMNHSVLNIKGQLLVVSQFTLHASTKKGNRPSFIKSAHPDMAIPLYESFVKKISEVVTSVETGVFGADMKISLINDGPVTILLDSKNKQ